MKIFAIVGVLVLAVVGILVGSYIISANRANALEQQIIAQYDANKVALSTYSLTIAESAQVPDLYKDDLVEVITAGLEGRYGEDGAGGLVVAIQEAYPGTMDSSLYLNIQNSIEGGRTNFRVEQNKLVEKVRIYQTELRNVWTGFWMRAAGYPSIDLNEYKIVTDARTQEVFSTKTEAPIKIGG